MQLSRSSEGAVAPTIALSLFALIAAGGIAFDYARMATLDSELQSAADQAALAAATQLDGETDAIARATAAANSLIQNEGRFANDNPSMALSLIAPVFCSEFDDSVANTDAACTETTSDADAHFVIIRMANRRAKYALTPIVGALQSSNLSGEAVAGTGSAICKVPPMMICNPIPGTSFDTTSMEGVGVRVTGHGNTRSGTGTNVSSWAPGDFGFLAVGSGQNSELIKALAFQTPSIKCYSIDDNEVSTGNPQALYDALNTRFDIFDFSIGQGTTLAPCFNGSCPSALNSVKDLVKADTATNGNKCKVHNQGWKLPTNQFWPRPAQTGDTAMTQMHNYTAKPAGIAAMGLPRDNCHYGSFGATCGGTGHLGNGNWARGDYFNKYHSGRTPAGASSMTRYETYMWELENNFIPYGVAAGASGNQYGRPVCSTGTVRPGTDRRVISLAVVENCSELSGSSTEVEISDWVDMFLVEPTIDGRGNGAIHDSIYMEVVGKTRASGNGSVTSQTIRRDVPYLIR